MMDDKGAIPLAVASFEQEIGKTLPAPYRSFLLKAFDDDREEMCFRANATGEEVWALSNFLRLDSESPYTDLARNWDPTQLYDLFAEKERLDQYIVIAEDDAGSKVLLHVESGEIWFLAHDWEVEDKSAWIGEGMSFFKVQESFDLFLRYLCSPGEIYDDDTFDAQWFDEAEMRRVQNEKIQEEHRQRKARKAAEQAVKDKLT
ncbi:MAG: SMI1/KNR4 family protein [Pseudomonadota bacterium]